MNEIKRRKHKSKEQKRALYIILKHFRKQETLLLIFFHDYSSMVSEVKYTSVHGKGVKYLKQMLERLLITLAQVKAGNTLESLLNEIRQIVYSLYRATEITKVYNNIIQTIKMNTYRELRK